MWVTCRVVHSCRLHWIKTAKQFFWFSTIAFLSSSHRCCILIFVSFFSKKLYFLSMLYSRFTYQKKLWRRRFIWETSSQSQRQWTSFIFHVDRSIFMIWSTIFDALFDSRRRYMFQIFVCRIRHFRLCFFLVLRFVFDFFSVFLSKLLKVLRLDNKIEKNRKSTSKQYQTWIKICEAKNEKKFAFTSWILSSRIDKLTSNNAQSSQKSWHKFLNDIFWHENRRCLYDFT